ncbi:MAG: J domain-containing protein [Flavobacteriales bacterium]|nr:J domain-containing protein [Flavobacteriales bacterium]MCB9448306.1 J domain-containing protein [Flavobacteriales bacterium]
MRIDYYKLLGVGRNASDQEIKRAYRRIAMEIHPDINPSPEANALFSQINLAYETLIDADKRFNYDYLIKYGRKPGTNPRPAQAPRTTAPPPPFNMHYADGPARTQSMAARNPTVVKSFFITIIFLGFLFITLPVRSVLTGTWDPVFIVVAFPGFLLIRDAWNQLWQ